MRHFHKKQKVWVILHDARQFPSPSNEDMVIACTLTAIDKHCVTDVYILWDINAEMTINCYSDWGIYSTREEAINDMINGRPKYAVL